MSGSRIVDGGLRRFEGVRLGVGGSVRSLAWHTVRSVLGLGRPARHKVFPVVVAVVAFLPAVVFVAIAVLIGDLGEPIRPDYWEFFGFSLTAALLFTAFVAPEATVRDRRNGMYALYLSTPLSPFTYLVAKAVAVVGVLTVVVVCPALLALVGYTVQGRGPDGPLEWSGVAARLVVGGSWVAVAYSAVSMAASAVTDRRAFASVAVVLVMVGGSVSAGVVVDTAAVSDAVRLLDPLVTPLEVPVRLFGDRSSEYATVGTGAVVAASAAWVAGASGFVVFRQFRNRAI